MTSARTMALQLIHPIIMNLIPPNFDMNRAIEEIKKLYFQPTLTPYSISFEKDTLRYAFFYRHFICVSNAVRASLMKLLENRLHQFNIIIKPVIGVCCIGGASGCDLLGFCQFMDSHDIKCKINAVILDYFNWKETKSLLDKLNIDENHKRNINNFNFVELDPSIYFTLKNPHATAVATTAAQEAAEEIKNQIRNADFITIVQYLSSAGGRHFENKQRLGNILSHVKIGSFVFFMDNSVGPYSILARKAAIEAKLTLTAEIENLNTFASEEESSEMCRHHFNELPQKWLSVTAYLWQKQT